MKRFHYSTSAKSEIFGIKNKESASFCPQPVVETHIHLQTILNNFYFIDKKTFRKKPIAPCYYLAHKLLQMNKGIQVFYNWHEIFISIK